MGGSLGLITGFIGTFFLKISNGRKWLSLIPMVVVTAGLGGFIGNLIGTSSQNSSNQSYMQFEAALSASPLKQVACKDDEIAIVRFMQSTPITESSPTLISIFQRCFDKDNHTKLEAFILIAQELVRRRPTSPPVNAPPNNYSFHNSGQWWKDNKSLDYYCLLINGLHEGFTIHYLQALRYANLPLFCTLPQDGNWANGLRAVQDQLQATKREEIWKYIQFIKEIGVNFKLPISPDKPAMIDYVIRCGEPRLIAFALDNGAISTDISTESAAHAWALRKLHPELRCPLTPYSSAAELAEIERISSRLSLTNTVNITN